MGLLYVSPRDLFQPFLRFWRPEAAVEKEFGKAYVSTLLEILAEGVVLADAWGKMRVGVFQPFLRFWGSYIRFLWVFKFFFGFLQVRRSV